MDQNYGDEFDRLFSEVRRLNRSGRSHDAIDLCNNILNGSDDRIKFHNDSQKVRVHYFKAVAQIYGGQSADAISTLKMALELAPDDRACLIILAEELIKVGQSDKAIDMLDRLLSIEHSLQSIAFVDEALFFKINALLRLGRIKEAEQQVSCLSHDWSRWMPEGELNHANIIDRLRDFIARSRRAS